MNQACEVRYFEVLEFCFIKFKGDLMTVADFLMDDEANIDAKWFAGIGHRNFWSESYRSKLLTP